MSWLSAFSRDRQALRARQLAHLRLGQAAEREAQHGELLARRGEQKIALVALGIGGAIKRAPARRVLARDDIVAGRQRVGAQIPGGFEQIGEFDVLVAGDAGDRRLAGDIGARERLDHPLAKPRLIVEHIMGNAEPRRHVARVMNVLSGAAGALAVDRLAMVVKLQGDADHVVTFVGHQRGDDRGIDTARHRDHDAGVPRRLGEAERVDRGIGGEGWRAHVRSGPADPGA